MTADSEKVTETRPVRPSTLRVRRYRERRREGMRLLTVEMPEFAIQAAIARGLLKPEESHSSVGGNRKPLRRTAFR